MAKEMLTREIDGFTYEIGMFPATKGCEVFSRLCKLCAPALGELGDVSLDQAAAAKMGAKAFAQIGQNLHVPDVVATVKDLLSVVSVQGVGQAATVFDMHFAGRYGALLGVCAAVVEHNGFFDALGFGASAATE